jgi:hypothetical protein
MFFSLTSLVFVIQESERGSHSGLREGKELSRKERRENGNPFESKGRKRRGDVDDEDDDGSERVKERVK